MEKPGKILAIPFEIIANYYLVEAPFCFYPTPKFCRSDVGISLLGFIVSSYHLGGLCGLVPLLGINKKYYLRAELTPHIRRR